MREKRVGMGERPRAHKGNIGEGERMNERTAVHGQSTVASRSASRWRVGRACPWRGGFGASLQGCRRLGLIEVGCDPASGGGCHYSEFLSNRCFVPDDPPMFGAKGVQCALKVY